jgi:hypothetical protein
VLLSQHALHSRMLLLHARTTQLCTLTAAHSLLCTHCLATGHSLTSAVNRHCLPKVFVKVAPARKRGNLRSAAAAAVAAATAAVTLQGKSAAAAAAVGAAEAAGGVPGATGSPHERKRRGSRATRAQQAVESMMGRMGNSGAVQTADDEEDQEEEEGEEGRAEGRGGGQAGRPAEAPKQTGCEGAGGGGDEAHGVVEDVAGEYMFYCQTGKGADAALHTSPPHAALHRTTLPHHTAPEFSRRSAVCLRKAAALLPLRSAV